MERGDRPARAGDAMLDAQVALRFASEVRALLAAQPVPEALLGAVARLALPAFGDLCIIDVRAPAATGERLVAKRVVAKRLVASVLPAEADERLRAVVAAEAPCPGFDDPALLAGEPLVLTSEEATRERLTGTGARAEAIRAIGTVSAVAAPMCAHGVLVGVMHFATTSHSGRQLTQADAVLAGELASQAAYALEHVGLVNALERELAERRAAEATLEGFFDAPASLLAIFDVDDDARDVVIRRPSAAVAALFGMSVATLAGRSVRALGAAEARVATLYDHFRRCRETGAPVAFDLDVRVPGEGGRWSVLSMRCVASRIGDDPKRASVAALAFDLTALRRSEAALAGFFDAPGTWMAIVELDDAARDVVIRRANPGAAAVLGLTPETASGRGLREVGLPAGFVDELFARYAECRRTGAPAVFEMPGVAALDIPPAQVGVRRIGDDARRSPLAVVATDLTEQQRLAAHLAGFFDAPGILMAEIAADDARRDIVVHAANDTFAAFHGHPREGVIGRTGRDLGISEEKVARLYALYRRCRESETPIVFELETDSPPGHWMLASLRRIGSDPQGARVASIFTDVTPLHESQARLEGFFAAPGVPMAILDLDDATRDIRITRANDAYAALWGLPPAAVEGRTLRALLDDEGVVAAAFAMLERCRQTGEPVIRETRLPFAHDERTFLATLWRIGSDPRRASIAWTAVDVSAEKQLQAELLQAQKMEAVGQLAGGIAHDFNNVLAVIGAATETLLQGNGSEDERRRDLLEVRRAVDRAAALTRQLLAFSRRQSAERQPVSFNDVVREMHPMLRRVLRADVAVELALAEGLPPVHADRGQLGQVLMNLVLNARDAMPDGGRVTIATRCVPGATATAPHFVTLTVTDTGIGMPADVGARAFEPFFTTKGPERGTGLGLATVRTIAEGAGGHVSVDSRPGAGATFTIALPALGVTSPPTDGAASTARVPDESTCARGSLGLALEPLATGGAETVLLVETDPAARLFAARALRQKGYEVLQAASGEEALALVASRDRRIHVLVTEVALPDTTGAALAEAVGGPRAGSRSSPRVVYLVDSVVDSASRADAHDATRAAPHVARPFTAETLARAVRVALTCPLHRRADPRR